MFEATNWKIKEEVQPKNSEFVELDVFIQSHLSSKGIFVLF